MDFEAKLQRVKRRRRWLRELQQEKSKQQLLSPLPLPTTLLLLSASVASSKTVISDPIRHLQNLCQDLLHSVVDFTMPPVPTQLLREVFMMRNLSTALSACIYQCLCDCDTVVIYKSEHQDVGLEGFTNLSTSVVYKDSFLMAGAQTKRRDRQERPNSAPSKWPGVAQLRAFIARERDECAPRLNILLCEALVAVHMSLFIHALAMYDCNMLYRLVAHQLTDAMWGLLFGGGSRKQIRVSSTPSQMSKPSTVSDAAKQRLKLNMRIIGPPQTSTKTPSETKAMFKESFVPPQTSIINYFMARPRINPIEYGIEYDSEASYASSEDSDSDFDEEDGDSVFDLKQSKAAESAPLEHMDPNSYSWCLMRHAAVKLVLNNIKKFLPVVGIELGELPVSSPLLQDVLRTLGQWQDVLKEKLDLFRGPPNDFIPGCYVDKTANGPAVLKYKSMQDPDNTPFKTRHYSSFPAKRLWQYLVRQAPLQDVFIRYIFKKKSYDDNGTDSTDSLTISEPVKLIHKDQDVLSSFCMHQGNMNYLALATHKEIIEMDISSILNPPAWLQENDETEYDIDSIQNPQKQGDGDFVVVNTPYDHQVQVPSYTGSGPLQGLSHYQTGHGGSVVTKRTVPNVRKMGSHPSLPYYLTGSQDGSVRMWEWGHSQPLSMPRQPGSFPKVTKVLFNTQGNKFGVSDGEGSLCLWQVGYGSNLSKPFLNLHCHSKATSDFVFVGSSSLIATAGHSSESRNVALWDTLLPTRSSCVQAFTCHEHGSQAIMYAPQHQMLITGGKKGDICIFDIRQRKQLHTFPAHESAIRCLSLDPCEEFFVTGSTEGDMKIWGLGVHNLIHTFPGEHSKNTLFNKNASGVLQISIGANGHLFSCGADGSLKVRHIPEKDLQMVHTWSQYSRFSSQHEDVRL